MNKRIWLLVLFLGAAGAARGADWKAEFLSYLSPRPDYKKAMDFLVDQSKSMPAADVQTAEALMAYLARKIGDAEQEKNRVSSYFEKYLDNDPDFGFLDITTVHDFVGFWGHWKSSYPLVSDLNLLSYAGRQKPGLPSSIEVGLELLNDAYYRVSLGPYILEGGFWPKGFHILTVPVSPLFEHSGVYEFLLDLKAGDLVLRKPLKIAVDITQVATVSSPAPPVVTVSRNNKPAQEPAFLSSTTGEIDLYVGDTLILKSRKGTARVPAVVIPVGGPSMPGQKPYMPPPTTDPIANSVPVLDALALTYKAVKDLFIKKPPKPSPPSYQKLSSLAFAFVHTEPDGRTADVRAVVHIERAKADILRQ